MTESSAKPNIEEQYSTATKTADMRVETREGCRNVADLIIANGLSPTYLGAALLRLHSEWDGAEKPLRPTSEAISALATTLPLIDPPPGARIGAPKRLDMAEAARQANAWYTHELHLLVGKLKTMPTARGMIAAKAVRWGIDRPTEFAGGVLKFWLDQTCHVCDGRKHRLIPGTPALSGKACTACQGSGMAPPQGGQQGRRMLNYMDDCVGAARRSIRKRLHNWEDAA